MRMRAKRRAQLVGGGGERVALGLDEGLDALRRAVEAAGQRRDLVLSLDIDPGGEIARAQRLDSRLQALQPARQAAGDRPGADGDGEREEDEGDEEADRRCVTQATVRAVEDEAPVRQRQGEGAASSGVPTGRALLRRRQGLGRGWRAGRPPARRR